MKIRKKDSRGVRENEQRKYAVPENKAAMALGEYEGSKGNLCDWYDRNRCIQCVAADPFHIIPEKIVDLFLTGEHAREKYADE